MARNLKLFFDPDGTPRVRGPSSEKILMAFLEADVQGSDHICHDLMDDLTAIEDESAESREFIGNAHSVVMSAEGVTIELNLPDDDSDADEQSSGDAHAEPTADDSSDKKSDVSVATDEKPGTVASSSQYTTGLKHFREVLEDWEAFILDDQSPA